jgi:hypothetical protein
LGNLLRDPLALHRQQARDIIRRRDRPKRLVVLREIGFSPSIGQGNTLS